MTTTVTSPRTISVEDIDSVVSILLGTSEHREALHLEARSDCGFGYERFNVSTIAQWKRPDGGGRFLEACASWFITVAPAVRDGASDRALRLHALFARWFIEPFMDVTTGWEWAIPAEPVAKLRKRIRSFKCPPTVVIDGLREITALWQLKEPMELRPEAAHAAVVDVQARLAQALGASCAETKHFVPSSQPVGPDNFTRVDVNPAYAPESFIPLCGIVREMGSRDGAPHVVTLDVEPERVFGLEEIERAIAKVGGTR